MCVLVCDECTAWCVECVCMSGADAEEGNYKKKGDSTTTLFFWVVNFKCNYQIFAHAIAASRCLHVWPDIR